MDQTQLNSSRSGAAVPLQTPRLDKATKVHINKLLRNAVDRQWCKKHGKILPPPKLPKVVLRVIKEWFLLVDDDGSGTLEHHELLAALQAARIPCDADSITEMIKLMDANCDGCISWDEFEKFMMSEFAAGQRLLSGEFVLPSGTALPFGAMVRQLKRNQMMKDVTEGGEARTKWLHFDVNITADAAELAQAEEAIRVQKEYNETLHLHIQHQHQQKLLAAATLQQWQQKLPGTGTSAAGGQVDAVQPGPAAAAIQAAAAADGLDSDGTLLGSTLSANSRPGGVPRLDLGSLSGSGASQQQRQQQHSAGSSSRPVVAGLLTERQTADLLSRLPANMHALVGSPRFACSSSSSQGTQQPGSARTGRHPATARSARNAAEKYAKVCSSARAAAATAASSPSAAGGGKLPTAAAAGGGQTSRNGAATAGSSAWRPYSASASHYKVQPQPSRDEWRAVAASCLTQRHATAVRGARGTAQQAAAAAAGPAGTAAARASNQPPVAGMTALGADTAGFAVRARQWEHPAASSASTAVRSQRAGAGPLVPVAGSPGRGNAAMAACYGVRSGSGSGSSSSSPRKQPAVNASHSPRPAAATGATLHAAAGRAEAAPPSNDNLLTPRTAAGRGLKACLAAARAGATSPSVIRQAAAAATGAPSNPHRAQGHNTASVWPRKAPAQTAAATPRSSRQCKSPSRPDRASASSSSSCSDSRGQCDTSSKAGNKTARHVGATTAAAAAGSGSERQPGSVLDASCKYLLSACAVPPSALLSKNWVGPVEAAVIRAHTPRSLRG